MATSGAAAGDASGDSAPPITTNTSSGSDASPRNTRHILRFCPNMPNETAVQQEFVGRIQGILDDGGPEYTGQAIIQDVRESFAPQRLFHPELMAMPEYYRRLRMLVENRGVTSAVSGEPRNLNVYRVARTIYVGDEWADTLNIALIVIWNQLPVNLRTGDPPTPSNEAVAQAMRELAQSNENSNQSNQDSISLPRRRHPPSQNEPQASPSQYVGIVLGRFKENRARFSGDLSESWPQIISDYNGVTRSLNMTDGQRLQLLPAILRGDAALYYERNVEGVVSTFGEAVALMEQEYNNISQQARIKNTLTALRFSQFLTDGSSPRDALHKLNQRIAADFPRTPPDFQTESNRKDILKAAVISEEWSTRAISDVHVLTYQTFYTQLAHDLQMRYDAGRMQDGNQVTTGPRQGRGGILQGNFGVNLDGSPEVLWQGHYSQPRRQTSVPTGKHFNQRKLTCWNCGKTGHKARECKDERKPGLQVVANLAAASNEEAGREVHDQRGAVEVFRALAEDMDEFHFTPQHHPVDNHVQAFFGNHPLPRATGWEQGHHLNDENGPASHLYASLIDNRDEHRHVGAVMDDAEEEVLFVAGGYEYKREEYTDNERRSIEACVDTGATSTVMGENQARAYCKLMGVPFSLKPSPMTIRFGAGNQRSLGTIVIRIPHPTQQLFFYCKANVVPGALPILLGLDFLDRNRFYPNTVLNILRNDDWDVSIPLHRSRGHICIRWDCATVYYTRGELLKLHQHFHPTTERLIALLRRSSPDQCGAETRQILNDIYKSCQVCSTFRARPLSFQVAIPEEKVIFNRELALDLFWLDGRPVLHVVDVDTGFNNADFLEGNTVEDVWQKFLDIWVTVYVGFPSSMKVDQGSQFQSTRWEKRAADSGIVLKPTGVECHNALGIGERYHAPLRRIFVKVRTVAPTLSSKHALRLAVKTMNDTAGPNGLVPSLLVFGVLPRTPATATSYPDQQARMLSIVTARLEYEKVVADLRIKQALNSRVPAAANYVIIPGDYVYAYRETDRRYHRLKVLRVEDKQLFLLRDGKEVQHNVSQVIPAWEMEGTSNHRQPPPDKANAAPRDNTEVDTQSTEVGNGNTVTAMVTETLQIGDPRSRLPEFEEAKQREIDGLEARAAWEIVDRKDIPGDANIIGGRFVLAIKDKDTDHPTFKARFVAQGHRDKERDFLVHSSTTASAVSVRLLVFVAIQRGFKIWSSDVKQAYLQSKHPLARPVYIRPPKELQYREGALLKLNRPLYGLCDSGDYWYNTFRSHLEGDLNMQRTSADPAFFFLLDNTGATIGITATYVDDTLNAGNPAFEEATNKTSRLFESRPKEFEDVQFAGIQLSFHEDHVTLHQRRHLTQVHVVDKSCDFRGFKSMLMTIAWAVHTRPDIACAVAQLAQVTAERYDLDQTKYIGQLNRVVRLLSRTPDRGIQIRRLNREGLRLRIYTDGAFANNEDSTSQLGYVITLVDKAGGCALICFKSYKSRRVVGSVIEAEAAAMVEAVNHGVALKRDIESVLGGTIQIEVFTDSMSLFDVVSRGTPTRNKRLMVDIRQLHQAYERFELSSVNHIRSQFNPADAMTKAGNNDVLRIITEGGKLGHPIALMVTRATSIEPHSHEGKGVSVGESLLAEQWRDEWVTNRHEELRELWYGGVGVGGEDGDTGTSDEEREEEDYLRRCERQFDDWYCLEEVRPGDQYDNWSPGEGTRG